MNYLKNTALVLLAFTTLGGALLAWHQYQELVELRAAALNANERADLQKKIWALQKANRTLQDQLLAATSKPTTADLVGDSEAPQPASPQPNFRRGAERFAAMRELFNKPEVQALVSTERKGVIGSEYAALFHNLNLSPDQIDKLTTLLSDRQSAIQDVFAAAREQGINPRTDPQGFQKLVADAESSINDSIKSLIGDNGFNQLTSYDQTMPQRNLVNALQQRLNYSDSPLTQGQSDQLVQILATNAPAHNNNLLATNFGRMGLAGVAGVTPNPVIGPGSAPITHQAINQAQNVLSQPQLTALQQMQQQQQAAQQLQKLIRNSLQPAPAPTTGGHPGGGG